jgi:type I restriction enzyme S subunit
MNQGWEIKTLVELEDAGIIQLGRGVVISKKDLKATPGVYPVYSSAQLNNGVFGHYGKYMFDEELITWSVDGGGALFHRQKHKYSITNVGGYCRVLNLSVFNVRYLFFILSYLHSTVQFDWVKKAHPSVLRKEYRIIPVPPRSEQQRIVAILDEAFAAIDQAKANTERNLKNAKELFESYLQGVFGNKGATWENKQLKNEIVLLSGFAFKSKHYSENVDDVLLVKGDNIMQGYFRWDDVKRWNIEEFDKYKRFSLNENDIVLAMDRPWVKAGLKCAKISKNELPALLVQRTACLRCGENMDSGFLFYLIKSSGFTNHLLGVQTGIGVPHISGQQILDFSFNCPSLQEQQTIVIQLDTLREETQKLETMYQKKLLDLDELKKSILQKAFAGELTTV